MSPTVAIIMRTKDRTLLLRRALESVVGQAFRDFELVIVNDGGDRSAVEQTVRQAGDVGKVSIVHNPTSVGREDAVNIGVAASTAPFIAVLDDDDTWSPLLLEQAVTYLSGSSDAAVVARTEVVYEEIIDNEVHELRREVLRSDLRRVTLLDTLYSNYAPPTSMLVRRSVFDEVGGWDGDLPVLADWDFNLKILSRHTIGFIDGEPLAFWHRRESQAGALGNSVHASAHEHVEFNVAVRDAYLKRYLATGNGLGELLFLAEGFRRVDSLSHGAHMELLRQFATVDARLEQMSGFLASHAVALDHLNARAGAYVYFKVPNWLRRVKGAFRPRNRTSSQVGDS
jgi:glycosyltransferase involved in cell wall biosynthesis